jgi:transposase
MQPPVTLATKSGVVLDWLRGLSRDAIAANHGLSAGTVTNIIRQWRLGLDQTSADELREFVVSLKRLRITAPVCAEGARIASMLTTLGIDKNDFDLFISETYGQCIKLGLQPERIVHDLKQFLNLSESVPWEQISNHIQQQLARKQQLEEEIQRLEIQASETKKRLDTA